MPSSCALIQSRAGTMPVAPVVGVEQELRVPKATSVWMLCAMRSAEMLATMAAMSGSVVATPLSASGPPAPELAPLPEDPLPDDPLPEDCAPEEPPPPLVDVALPLVDGPAPAPPLPDPPLLPDPVPPLLLESPPGLADWLPPSPPPPPAPAELAHATARRAIGHIAWWLPRSFMRPQQSLPRDASNGVFLRLERRAARRRHSA
jgi:hypothetical protein